MCVSSYGDSADESGSWLLKEPETLGKVLLASVLSCLGWFTFSFMSASLLLCASLLLSSLHSNVGSWGKLHITFQEHLVMMIWVLAGATFCSLRRPA